MTIGLVKEILGDKPREGRLLGIDQGQKRHGIAISDPFQNMATALETIQTTKFSKDVEQLASIYNEYECVGMVIGLPLNMDGSEGPRAQSVRQFAQNIKNRSELFKTPLWIGLWDERLSSSAAQDMLIEEVDMNRKRRGQVIDKLASQIILQGALDFIHRT
tara:strand:+ start:203 stop:685 length:483 start_codon:yes stop_codon:yes gene_type:complete